jgi:hypothetical protein
MQKGVQIARAPSLATSWKHLKGSRCEANMVVIGGVEVICTKAGFFVEGFSSVFEIIFFEDKVSPCRRKIGYFQR